MKSSRYLEWSTGVNRGLLIDNTEALCLNAGTLLGEIDRAPINCLKKAAAKLKEHSTSLSISPAKRRAASALSTALLGARI